MASVRKEKDLLGEKEISNELYYGIQTKRALENFPITGYAPHPTLIHALAVVKKSSAEANMEVGRLNKKIGQAICKACEEIIQGDLHQYFVVDAIQGGAGTSMNMNANEVIANRAIELLGGKKGEYIKVSPNTHVNMAQSTNDAFPTAINIAALKLAQGVLTSLNGLIDALKGKEAEFDEVLKMGRTHLQDAVPIRLGQEFGAYAKVLSRDVKRIEKSLEDLKEINMGATAVGTGLNADPKYIEVVVDRVNENSGIEFTTASNLVDSTQNTDAFVAVSAALKICAVNLSKMANDLRLLSSGPKCGLNEINLPPVQPGSSIMPGKVNPVMAEVVNQVAFQIMGNDHTICLASEAGQLELNVMEPVLTFNLLQSLDILRNVTTVFADKCIKGITVNEERCRQLVDESIGIVTAINPHVGYETASTVAQEAIKTGRPIKEIVLERGILTEEELEKILNPYDMTRPGISGSDLLK
ncbi:aspartate ammonia-lyase [Proteinivorax hydrogeniformans]|uniref:Aspartate ammonia-lyase n=1 Tax=Proteinivorax hydrogeniformans TaxID=1826727 RepID=A0AAU8HWJ8_9FIRM